MDIGLLIIGFLVLCLALFFSIRKALVDAKRRIKAAEIRDLEKNPSIQVRLLLLLSRLPLACEKEIMILSGLAADQCREAADILIRQGYIGKIDEGYYITLNGLTWIRRFDGSEPGLTVTAQRCIEILRQIHEEMKDRIFKAEEIGKKHPNEWTVYTYLNYLEKNGFLLFASDKDRNSAPHLRRYAVNPDKDVRDLLEESQ